MSDPQRESMERIQGLAQGAKGDKGDEGEPGELSRPLRRALVFLFAVAALLALVALLVGFREIGAIRAQDAQNIAAQHREQAAQQRAGRVLEAKLCTTFDSLAALKPPAGNPDSNPSRAYLQQQHDRLAQIGADLGCR